MDRHEHDGSARGFEPHPPAAQFLATPDASMEKMVNALHFAKIG
jgi:hypothetical protein